MPPRHRLQARLGSVWRIKRDVSGHKADAPSGARQYPATDRTGIYLAGGAFARIAECAPAGRLGVGSEIGDAPLPGMTVDHTQRLATYVGQPTSEVLLAARLRSEIDLLFDSREAQAVDNARQDVGYQLLALAATMPRDENGPSARDAGGSPAEIDEAVDRMVESDLGALVDWLNHALTALGIHLEPVPVTTD